MMTCSATTEDAMMMMTCSATTDIWSDSRRRVRGTMLPSLLLNDEPPEESSSEQPETLHKANLSNVLPKTACVLLTSTRLFASALFRAGHLLVAVPLREVFDMVVLLAHIIDLLEQFGDFLRVGSFRMQAFQDRFGRLQLLQASLEVIPEFCVVGGRLGSSPWSGSVSPRGLCPGIP